MSNIGLDVKLTHYYSWNRVGKNISKIQWIGVGISLQPTTRWKVSYNFQYDIQNKIMTSGTVNVTRDMHCWQGMLVWVPSGVTAGYYVRIYIKAIPDIKVESTQGGLRGQYY